jgi:RNA polymerase sigma-70 factor (ECF subfamily)
MGQEQIWNLAPLLRLEQVEQHRKSQDLEEQLVELYANMRGQLLGYAYHVVGCTGEAEDLVQIAFLKLFDQMKRDARILNLRSWLYRVVHNLAIDQVRRKGIQETSNAEWFYQRIMNDTPRSAESDLIQRQHVALSMRALNERERQCLMLRAEGLSYAEIGEVLGVSAKAVSVYLARGLKKFQVLNGHA